MSDSKPKRVKVMNIIAEATGGKSYKAHKYTTSALRTMMQALSRQLQCRAVTALY